MKVLDFIYNKTTISFEPNGNDDVMVNATEMAKVFDKRIDHFLKADHVQNFIEALKLPLNGVSQESKNGENSGEESSDEFPPNGGNSECLKHEEIIQTRGQNGTWMHRLLALKFAAWLDPKFEVWVWRTVDKIILGHYKEQKEATTEKLLAENELEKKKKELLKKYPEFIDFLNIEGKISNAEKRRLKAIKAAVTQLRLDLFTN